METIAPKIKHMCNAYILIEPEKAESEQKEGSLYVVKHATEHSTRGRVLLIGPYVDVVQPGDIVYYPDVAPEEGTLDTIPFVIIEQDDILATVKGGE